MVQHTKNSGDVDQWIAKLKNYELLHETEVKQLCEKAIEIMAEEPNIRNVQSPVTICGDIRGQFFDLLEMFKVGGSPPDTSYVFQGGYMGRGVDSIETISLLLALKVRYPELITLLLGRSEIESLP
eukprot:CAMPEP_0170464682 /NCGR_PEP_ID=MMETSP0123-20130129/9313_1 /TAXON_ID=182087 /ORGANISM="Favella ehrenbergii, Strain Fehren 1" /LENGTH=125 /DNA_ID=CAMNT_0010730397 /DNA_START=12 /DNA_END=389 /DNA_ORIENTATION=+